MVLPTGARMRRSKCVKASCAVQWFFEIVNWVNEQKVEIS